MKLLSNMEDYIRGLLCGYLTVQSGTRDETAKRQRMFVVLSDSRMDFYDTDPRPEFKIKISHAYIFRRGVTRVHYYAELHPRAPPHSLCLTTEKVTDVYIAESEPEATRWYEHLNERLQALATMVTGSLLMRKELSADQQLKRIVFKTKYRWKARYVELGRASIQFCKSSERREKSMKQFTLTGSSYVSEEGPEYLKRLRVFASYSVPVIPSGRVARHLERSTRYSSGQTEVTGNSYQASLSAAVQYAGVGVYFPFIVATGETFLLLAAVSQKSREEWVTAIRMRIIALKYRHNHSKDAKNDLSLPKLQGFVDAQPKPGADWKRVWVDLDNGILRLKSNERKLGAIIETRLIPTCQITPSLSKANAFAVSNLGDEIAFAPSNPRESSRWMNIILESAKTAELLQYQRAFEPDIQQLLRHSVSYALVVQPCSSASLLLENVNKRVVVISHNLLNQFNPTQQESTPEKAILGFSLFSHRKQLVQPRPRIEDLIPMEGTHILDLISNGYVPEIKQGNQTHHEQLPIPPGSVLVGIQHFGMMFDTFDNMWHKVRQKKPVLSSTNNSTHQPKQPMRLIFRAPLVRDGLAHVKYRAGDDWTMTKCYLESGKLRINCCQGHHIDVLSLRFCLAELINDENCPNCIKITQRDPAQGSASNFTAADARSRKKNVEMFMKFEPDADQFVWFEYLLLEIAVAQDGSNFAMKAMSLKRAAQFASSRGRLKNKLPSSSGYAADQARAFGRCYVVGNRLKDIQSDLVESSAAQTNGITQLCGICGITSGDSIHKKTKTLASYQDNSSMLLDANEICALYDAISAITGGQVGIPELAETLDQLTQHLRQSSSETEKTPARRSSVGGFLGNDFCKAVHALTSSSGRGGGISVAYEAFETIASRIEQPDVLDLVRRFIRGELHFM